MSDHNDTCEQCRSFRALISVPIEADSLMDAMTIAFGYANLLNHPDSDVTAGHVEVVGQQDVVMILERILRRLEATLCKELPDHEDAIAETLYVSP